MSICIKNSDTYNCRLLIFFKCYVSFVPAIFRKCLGVFWHKIKIRRTHPTHYFSSLEHIHRIYCVRRSDANNYFRQIIKKQRRVFPMLLLSFGVMSIRNFLTKKIYYFFTLPIIGKLYLITKKENYLIMMTIPRFGTARPFFMPNYSLWRL